MSDVDIQVEQQEKSKNEAKCGDKLDKGCQSQGNVVSSEKAKCSIPFSNYVLCVQARTLQTHFPSPTLTRSIGQ